MAEGYIRWFSEIGVGDVPLVGGKTASLGELYSKLSGAGVTTPNGFAIAAQAYRDALAAAGAEPKLRALLEALDPEQCRGARRESRGRARHRLCGDRG